MNRPLFAASLLLFSYTGTALAGEHNDIANELVQQPRLLSDGPDSRMQLRLNNANTVGFPRFIVQRGFSNAY